MSNQSIDMSYSYSYKI